jgi:hypothetical protein
VPTDAIVSYTTVRKDGHWSQSEGSMQGGTMLWIYGKRFALNSFSAVPSAKSSNTVQLVDDYAVFDCEMHTDKVTSTQLTCYVPAMPESVYQVRVYVNGHLIPLYQYVDVRRAIFASVPDQTPIIDTISPQSGPTNSLISLAGLFKTACYARDIEGCAQDNNPLISRYIASIRIHPRDPISTLHSIFIGGHLCNLINPNTGTVYVFESCHDHKY